MAAISIPMSGMVPLTKLIARGGSNASFRACAKKRSSRRRSFVDGKKLLRQEAEHEQTANQAGAPRV
jgi:hypothetical protein